MSCLSQQVRCCKQACAWSERGAHEWACITEGAPSRCLSRKLHVLSSGCAGSLPLLRWSQKHSGKSLPTASWPNSCPFTNCGTNHSAGNRYWEAGRCCCTGKGSSQAKGGELGSVNQYQWLHRAAFQATSILWQLNILARVLLFEVKVVFRQMLKLWAWRAEIWTHDLSNRQIEAGLGPPGVWGEYEAAGNAVTSAWRCWLGKAQAGKGQSADPSTAIVNVFPPSQITSGRGGCKSANLWATKPDLGAEDQGWAGGLTGKWPGRVRRSRTSCGKLQRL